MKVFVIGGTGAIGRHAVRSLVAAGHPTTAVARTSEKAAQVREDGAEPVEVSIFDSSALAGAAAGHDAVVNLASKIPPMDKFMSSKAWAANDRVRREGSAAIVDAARTVGIDRVIQESVVMIYPDGGNEWITEETAPEEYPLAQGNLAAEASAARFTADGGAGVVLRFGWFYGPGATHSEQFYAMAERHICVQMGRAGTFLSSIHMADAGAAVVAALGVPAGIYNVVDDEPLTKRGYADALAEATGAKAWIRSPGPLALLLGDRSTSLTRSIRASNERFRTASGWAPGFPSAREGWKATAAELG